MKSIKRMIKIVAMVTATMILFTACSAVKAEQTVNTTENSTKTEATTIAGVKETTSNIVAGDINGDGKIVVGFANINESAELHTVIKTSMENAAAAKGWELVYMNNKADGQTAVSNADAMLLRGIDVFIEFNVDISVAPTIMEKMNDAKIPVVAVDIAMPGAVYFGANNYGVGPIVGEYLAGICSTEWKGEPDCLLIVEDVISGETVLARTNNVIDGFRKIFPDFSDDKVFYIDGGSDTSDSQQVVANFLAAHPDFDRIAVAPAHVTMTLGALAAIETAGREKQCLLVSQGEYDYLDYLKKNPSAPDWELFRGTLVYDFKNYGTYCMDIVGKLLNGEKVDAENFPKHYIIDRSNAAEFFPEAFK